MDRAAVILDKFLRIELEDLQEPRPEVLAILQPSTVVNSLK